MDAISTQTLQQFLDIGVYTFLLVFVRIGTALMLLPGFGDTYTPTNIRLYTALAISLVLFPALKTYMPPEVPGTFAFFMLIIAEFMIGAFIGIVSRILLLALDTAGMVISMQAGLANAQIFNPQLSSQASITGTFFLISGVMLIFATDLHHFLIAGMVNSYKMFPVGEIPDSGSMAQIVTRAVASAFYAGIHIAAPFIVITLLLYIGMGVLSRLMPQLQIFLLGVSVQLILSFLILAATMSAGLAYWLGFYQNGLNFFFSG
ncbi:MAG: flagellar biosynthetic protein FliR [Pseudobdellovibrionaceae bacterium]